MSALRLAVLDCDGVVIDSFRPTLAATNRVLTRLGTRSISGEDFRANEMKDFLSFLRERGVNDNNHSEVLRYVIAEEFAEPDDFPVFPGIWPVLKRLRKLGLPVYLMSACEVSTTQAKLKQTKGLSDHFAEVFCAERKSHRIAHLCHDMGIPTNQAVLISDMEKDFTDCREDDREILRVGLVSEFSTAERLAAASDYLCQNHAELLAWLKSLP